VTKYQLKAFPVRNKNCFYFKQNEGGAAGCVWKDIRLTGLARD
jgi:hypothetical protein